jgi:hypothetical protein
VKPDVGCLVQPKHVALKIAIKKLVEEKFDKRKDKSRGGGEELGE